MPLLTPAPVGSRDWVLGRLARIGQQPRHVGTVHLMKQFAWSHLPAHLQNVSAPLCDVALGMCLMLPDGPELTAGLRKLREAKDCFVIAAVDEAAAQTPIGGDSNG